MNKNDFFSKTQNQIKNEAECISYCRAYWKEDMEHILRVAEETANGTFLFDLNWDMERTYQPVHFGQNVVWDYMPGKDPEFIFQLNRHRYFICLGQAYLFTGQERFAESFVSLFLSWSRQNPLTEDTKKTTWRTIEAGLRGENWTKAIRYFRNSPSLTDEILDLFVQELLRHGDYLYQHKSPFSKKSNWGVLENSGLLAIGCALRGEAIAEEYIKTAMERLTEEVSIQVYEDGVHWEQSPMYHNEVLHCCMESIRLARENGYAFSKDFERTVEKMAEVNAAWKKPNHCQITQGDSDETDLRDMLTQGAYLFCNEKMKQEGYKRMDFEGIWDYGISSNHVFTQIAENCGKKGTEIHDFAQSGNYYILNKDDHGKTEGLFHFSHGDLGGGHGHFDRLHLDLSLGGEDILVDSGRYTYVDSRERFLLKYASAHNVPMVDGREYMEYLDSWSSRGDTPLIPAYVKHKNGTHLYRGSHLGYFKQGVFVTRTIIIPSPSIYLIMDEFLSEGEHDYEQLFHFHPQGQAALVERKAVYQGKQTKAVFHFLTEGGQIEMLRTNISRHYNQLEENQTIKVSVHRQGNASMLTVITKDNENPVKVERIPAMDVMHDKELSGDIAEAVRITQADGEEVTVIIGHKEAGVSYELFGNQELYGLGNIFIFHKKEKDLIRTILK